MYSNLPPLTKRQESVYLYIDRQIRDAGRPPTVREIGERFSITSPNGVMCHLRALEKKGYIERDENLSRAITLTKPKGLPVSGKIKDGNVILYTYKR